MNQTIILKSLTQFIKDNPDKLMDCSKKLSERLISRLAVNLDSSDLDKLSILYQFIIIYSIVTSDLSLVSRVIYSPTTIKKLILSLCNGSLILTREKEISNMLIEFAKINSSTLDSEQNIIFAGLYFNKTMFYDVVLIIHDSYLPNIKGNQ